MDIKQGAEGVNFTALGSLVGIPAVVLLWVFLSFGGFEGLMDVLGMGSSPEYDFSVPTGTPTAEYAVDLMSMFDVATNAPASTAGAIFLITSVPSPTPSPTDWVWQENNWSNRGCNTEFPGFVSCGTGENCVETGAGWINCDQPPVDFSTFPTALPSPYFITVTPTLSDGHNAGFYSSH